MGTKTVDMKNNFLYGAGLNLARALLPEHRERGRALDDDLPHLADRADRPGRDHQRLGVFPPRKAD